MKALKLNRAMGYTRVPWVTPMRSAMREKALLVVVITASLLAIIVFYARPVEYAHDFGVATNINGLYPPERNESFSYAFMRDDVTLDLFDIGRGSFDTTIRMGGPRAAQPLVVHVGIRERPLVVLDDVRDVRSFHLLVPSDSMGSLPLKLDTTYTQPTGDARTLGALLDTVRVRSLGRLSPPPSVFWTLPLVLVLVWLIGIQWIPWTNVRIAVVVAAALTLCVVYGFVRARLLSDHRWYLNAAISLGVVAVTARFLLMPHTRAWLRSARWLTAPLAIFLGTRLGIMLVAYIADPLMSDGNDHGDPKSNIVLEVFTARWDSAFYRDIATYGYTFSRETLSSVAFFPLLPMLMRGLSPVLASPLAGLLVTNMALLCAAIFFYRVVEPEWGPAVAERSVWYLLIFPMSFFGSFLYSESLFLLGAIGALLFARRGQWIAAGCFGAIAAASRFLGILVAPMLLIEWWMQRRQPSPTRPSFAGVLGACIVPLGTGAYMLYLQQAFGDPLAFAHASAVWGRAPDSPWTTITTLFKRPDAGWGAAILSANIPLNDLIDLGSVVVFGILGVILLRERRWSEGVFVLLGVLISSNSGLLASQRRYVWVLFPVFVLLARWGTNQWVDRIITALFLLGLGLFTAMIANHYWVA